MNKQPTQEQIKELWEWCGLKQNGFGNWGIWNGFCLDLLPDNSNWGDNIKHPTIDLNNLFKYAVPKLLTVRIYGNVPFHYQVQVSLPPTEEVHVPELIQGDWYKDPALALFWAIWEVIHTS